MFSLQHSHSLQLGSNLHRVETGSFSGDGKELYKLGAVFILADFKPQTVNDFKRYGNWWHLVFSVGISKKKDTKPTSTFQVISKHLPTTNKKPLFMIFLMNITINRRIWNALHMDGSSKLIEKISCASDMVS